MLPHRVAAYYNRGKESFFGKGVGWGSEACIYLKRSVMSWRYFWDHQRPRYRLSPTSFPWSINASIVISHSTSQVSQLWKLGHDCHHNPQWGIVDIEFNVPFVQDPEPTHILPLTPGVCQKMATHASPTARISSGPITFICFISSLCFLNALVLAVSRVGPRNKIGHLAHSLKRFE